MTLWLRMARTVSIDPGGNHPDWLYVVIEHRTGVVYRQQYGGTACCQGEIEGYLVPVHAPESLQSLRDVFEVELKGAGAGRPSFRWRDDLLEQVISAVEAITFWPNLDQEAEQLSLDEVREIDEGWIRVLTSCGTGVLIWKNSD